MFTILIQTQYTDEIAPGVDITHTINDQVKNVPVDGLITILDSLQRKGYTIRAVLNANYPLQGLKSG